VVSLTRGAIPLYYQIAQILRSQINSQEYKPKDMLPTEDELIQTFGVSRTTVRQALQVLLNEGLIHRIPGKGTFVTDEPISRPCDWSVGSLQAIVDSGYASKLKFLGQARLPAGESLANSLGIPPGTEVMQLRKLQLVNGEPFFHITLYVPLDLGVKLPLELIEQKPVFVLIEEYCGCRIQEARQWVDASLAGTEIAGHLKLKPGDPVVLVERHFVAISGRIVEVSIDHYRTDRMRHFMRLTRSVASPVPAS
jgi:GntR family transcriptional regulator